MNEAAAQRRVCPYLKGHCLSRGCMSWVIIPSEKGFSGSTVDPSEVLSEEDFSVRTFGVLKGGMGITTVKEAASVSAVEYLRQPNFGRASLNELKGYLRERGYDVGFSMCSFPDAEGYCSLMGLVPDTLD